MILLFSLVMLFCWYQVLKLIILLITNRKSGIQIVDELDEVPSEVTMKFERTMFKIIGSMILVIIILLYVLYTI
ncbi:hypothetical protein R2F61_07440 [Mollicutes bacterium LVI A0078]|nr:hypothetical protein RZE84_07215 [Mollicutes bacterium LVI A0075]WOO90557.1 hypothetical protein R2F61_07440 [Mollicutes bacterium LVI A0078]